MSAVEDMPAALADARKTRAEFFEAVALPVEPYPPPAEEAAVSELEQRLGKALPPSYRRFLLTQDGWPDFDGEVDLLSVSGMAAIRPAKEAKVRAAIAEKTKVPEAERWLIFGLSSDSINSYLFDPVEADAEQEWPVIEFDKVEGIERRHANFTDFLKVSADDFRESLEETRQGDDLLDMDF